MRMLLAIIAILVATAASAQAPDDGGSRPVPDPTTLTTQQLDREIESLTKLVQSWRDGDAALVGEKFNSVAAQFQQRDAAVVAAFAAQNAAIGKTEQNFASLLAALDAKQAETTKNFEAQIQGIVVRLAATEGQSRGSDDTWAEIMSAVALAIAAIGALFGIAAFFKRPEPTNGSKV